MSFALRPLPALFLVNLLMILIGLLVTNGPKGRFDFRPFDVRRR
nr:MAG TPA: hypothetical protein [Bacteriophage sp.]